jgi:spermidine/putrescine-binding protein
MTHRYDGSSLDLEKRLVYYMVRNRVSRRTLLERMAKYGSAVALAPVVAACAGSAASPSARPSAAAPSAAPQSVAPSQSAAPTPVPSPEAELNVYNWLDYIGEGVIESFEEKYGVKVNYDLFDDIYAAYEVLGDDGAGYDVSFPIGVDLPDFIARGVVQPLDHSLIPNLVNLGAEWADPGYDPGNAHSMPYVWWTTGIGYDTTKITEAPTSSNALWDPRWSGHISMMDDYAETFGLTLIQLGFSANTENTAELDQALARLQEQKEHVRTYTNDTVTTMAAGDVWIGMIWGSDVYQIWSGRTRTSRTTSPRRAVSADRTRWRSTRAPSTPSPRTSSSITCSTLKSAPPTPTTSATWARTPRRWSSSARTSSPTRRSTRRRRSWTTSRSCWTCRTPSTTSTSAGGRPCAPADPWRADNCAMTSR